MPETAKSAWNKGRVVGKKPPLTPDQVALIRCRSVIAPHDNYCGIRFHLWDEGPDSLNVPFHTANGLLIVILSATVNPSCMSSESTVSHPANSPAATIIAS